MNKYYNTKPSYASNNPHQFPSSVPQNQRNLDNFFNSNSSISLSRENTLKPKYFDRLGSRNDKTGSELDLPNGFNENEILNASHYRGNETNNIDLSVINALNNVRFTKNNRNESYRNPMISPSNPYNYNKNHQNVQSPNNMQNNQYYDHQSGQYSKNIQSKQYNGYNGNMQNGQMSSNRENANYNKQNSNISNNLPQYNGNNNNYSNSRQNQETQINKKVMEINQMLSKLIPLTEQRKTELIRKTSQISSKDRSQSLLTAKATSIKNQSMKTNDHASLKLLSKIRKDSSIFNIDDSEESDDETNVNNNIFNNNMSYLNSSINGANPGRLLNKNKTTGNYSLPVNEQSVSVNYNNRSAEPYVGGYYLNSQYNKNSTQNKKSFNQNKTVSTMTDKKKIFEINKTTVTSDSKMSGGYYNTDEVFCAICLNYIEKKYFMIHEQNCRKNRRNTSNKRI